MPVEHEAVVLCVDDEEENLNLLYHTFRKKYTVCLAHSGQEALEICRNQEIDLVLTDQRMPEMLGVDLLAVLAGEQPEVVRILVTGYADVSSAVEAINRGKVHRYITKPWDRSELAGILQRELDVRGLRLRNLRLTHELQGNAETLESKNRDLEETNRRLEIQSKEYARLYRELQDQVRQNQTLRHTVKQRFSLQDLVGRSEAMRCVFQTIRDIAETDSTVLILGETGTGKELVARAIHAVSPRREGPFVGVNCAALSQELLDSELFGHEKGAFTGAIRQKRGRFELAQGGTLFLDEIGDLPPATQVRLLRVLQERSFERLGGETVIHADARILSATNRDLAQALAEGSMREDLYYRLNVISIEVPPLRERPEDVPLLSEHFLARYAAVAGKRVTGFSSEAMQILLDYQWPGNVRELENLVERAVALSKDETVHLSVFPSHLAGGTSTLTVGTLREVEQRLIHEALERTGWNKHQAAKLLGITRSTLYGKIRRYSLRPSGGEVETRTVGS